MHNERSDRMKTLLRLALLIVLILAMPAPAVHAWPFKSKVTRENYEKIHNGMTKAQVELILGKPTEMKSEMGLQDLGEFDSWIYWHRGTMVMIGFCWRTAFASSSSTLRCSLRNSLSNIAFTAS
jgi:hypothetical protein